ncbi:MAG: ParB/RepB/Spo0J family partition protein [Candidatus Woesearchaeota archaeon]
MKHLGVHNIRHDKIIIGENERTMWGQRKLEELCRSIAATGGNVTPAIVELLGHHTNPSRKTVAKLNSGSDKPFKEIAGHRRYEATRITGTLYKANVYYQVTDAERFEMQMIENSTKVEIPVHELGENICELYKLFVAECLGKRKEKQYKGITSSKDYEWLRSILPYTKFTKITNIGKDAFGTARLYDKTDENIKKMVRAGKFRYSAAAEIGRIPVEMQKSALHRIDSVALEHGSTLKEFGRKSVRKITQGYINSKQPSRLVLSMQVQGTPFDYIDTKQLSETIAKIACLKTNFPIPCLEEIAGRYKPRLADLERYYGARLKAAARSYNQRNKTLIERLAEGCIKHNGKSIAGIDISKAKYMEIPAEKIRRCRNQARKTFDCIAQMAATIRKYGVLQPILVRPKDGKYEIVAGERRYKGARRARLRKIPAICCPMDDLSAHIIRREEDLFETIDPRDRAENICRLYRQVGGSEREFSQKYMWLKPKAGDLSDALHYGQLDETTKQILENKSYSHGVAIYTAEPEQRKHYALMSVILGIPAKKISRKIAEDKMQPMLFSSTTTEGLQRKLEKELLQRLAILDDPEIRELGDRQLVRLYGIIKDINKICN